MSDQPEHDQAMPDQANAAADATVPAPSIEAPLIRTNIQPAASGKGRRAASRQPQRKTTPVFDAVATVASEALPSEPDLPVVTAGGAGSRNKTQMGARSAFKSRHAKHRRSWSRASGWILFGVCGASAVLVAVLQLNLLHRPAGNGAATLREGLRTSSPENAAQVPPLPKFKPAEFSRSDARPKEAKPVEPPHTGTRQAERKRAEPSRASVRPTEVKPDEFSRTGVRPMDAEEMARRRKQIDNFAEMGRAEEDRLHREKPKTVPPGKPESP